jgi:hypothetical protein
MIDAILHRAFSRFRRDFTARRPFANRPRVFGNTTLAYSTTQLMRDIDLYTHILCKRLARR